MLNIYIFKALKDSLFLFTDFLSFFYVKEYFHGARIIGSERLYYLHQKHIDQAEVVQMTHIIDGAKIFF